MPAADTTRMDAPQPQNLSNLLLAGRESKRLAERETAKVEVTGVTNLAGHKLPSGVGFLSRVLHDHEAAIGIQDGTVLWGSLPRRTLAHALAWRETHVAELLDDWERARQHQALRPIEPLE